MVDIDISDAYSQVTWYTIHVDLCVIDTINGNYSAFMNSHY